MLYISYLYSMKHVTNDKGDVGVFRITAHLIESGYPVFQPVSSSCPFDLLVYIDNKFKRVQVKYRKINSTGVLNVTMTRSVISNSKITSRYNEEVDILAIYCPDNNQCYYIKDENFSKCISLRIYAPKNNQSQGIRMAENYVLDNLRFDP